MYKSLLAVLLMGTGENQMCCEHYVLSLRQGRLKMLVAVLLMNSFFH
jgi:hypothetical protein